MLVALSQLAPVLLDREATTAKIVSSILDAGRAGAALVTFGEALLPGYPAWLAETDGARFDSPLQKAIHARYLHQAVDVGAGHLEPVREAAARARCAVVLGIVERVRYSLYCARVMIGSDGALLSVHRKLQPTYEERLVWATGDGAGLVVHRVEEFTVGALNCWENWMPLARAALYELGEDLHVMLWPGSRRNTVDLTPILAREGRSFVLSASGLLRGRDVPADFPDRGRFVQSDEQLFCDGGSCAVDPRGRWLVEPQVGAEGLFLARLDVARVREERQNFDPAGHYARPDVLQLRVDRERRGAQNAK
jgi:nitrilase